MSAKNAMIKCYSCPQSIRRENTHDGKKGIFYACKDNWYARLEKPDKSLPRNSEDDLVELTPEQIREFWQIPRYNWFSCPYRREKLFYKGLPLIFSLLALTISLASLLVSAIGNDTVKEIFGRPKTIRPTQLEQPIQVTVIPQLTPISSASSTPVSSPTPQNTVSDVNK